jgi:threonine dehydrogenase-like Zn-dependent dehydrogenase
MKALVLRQYNDLHYEDAPEPQPGPDEVLIAVKACGICGSDVHGMDGSTGRRIPPVIMGHEAAGVIAALGPGVDGWRVGDRVTFDSTIYCGKCRFCRAGLINLCDNRRVLGVSCGDYRQNGAFAEYVVAPQRILYHIPEAVSFERAATIEAISIAFHAVARTPVALNDTAVVVGAGMIGLLIIESLRIAGCGRIVSVDVDPSRLSLARKLGADAVVNPSEGRVDQVVRDMTAGAGADVAFEAVGLGATLQTAIDSLRKGGSLCLVGNVAPKVHFALQQVVTRQITLYGSCASCGEYPACLDMLARGALDVDSLISAVAPLSDGAAWFGRLHRHEPGLMKVILQP